MLCSFKVDGFVSKGWVSLGAIKSLDVTQKEDYESHTFLYILSSLWPIERSFKSQSHGRVQMEAARSIDRDYQIRVVVNVEARRQQAPIVLHTFPI